MSSLKIENEVYNTIRFDDSGSGMEVLKNNSEGLMRGLLRTPAHFGKFPDFVRNNS